MSPALSTDRLATYRLCGHGLSQVEKAREIATPDDVVAFRMAYEAAGLAMPPDVRAELRRAEERVERGARR